ncbi:uncharacterized protein PRCAT00001138001 [Priceomyces carsonii]|uniref:uncharacterized protein n=1 Tax=Priceomyces carsonii TaxID=28549 RepID=UPI002ED808DB|nr:unnamed protein product [Priceomyces carsonii]
MPTIKPKRRLNEDRPSKQRALNAFILTLTSLFVVILLVYHAFWAVKVVYYNQYGRLFSSLVYGPGTLVANAGLSTRFLKFLNRKLLEDTLDTDHKKYI